MEIKVKLVTKGNVENLIKYLKKSQTDTRAGKGLKDTLSYKNLIIASADEIKRTIFEGKTFRTLKRSTQRVRKLRGHNVQKPLYASGALYESIKPVKGGVEVIDYGVHQANGFVPDNVPARNKMNRPYTNSKMEKSVGNVALKKNTKGIVVPARNFLTLPSAFAEKQLKKVVNEFGGRINQILRGGGNYPSLL
tara:strand:+ start:305 stop:883 length:579 start_codon:yes stop_codon:yes gene_type:complete